jgi:hypothetical protein
VGEGSLKGRGDVSLSRTLSFEGREKSSLEDTEEGGGMDGDERLMRERETRWI